MWYRRSRGNKGTPSMGESGLQGKRDRESSSDAETASPRNVMDTILGG